MSTVKIVRLVSGEDIIGYVEEENDSVLLGSPMTVFFKRLPSSGKSIMMMSYWLPHEIVEEDIVEIPRNQVLFIMDAKETIIDYYVSALVEADNVSEESSLEDTSDEDIDVMELLNKIKSGPPRTLH